MGRGVPATSFLTWRFERRTDGETLVAMSGSKCIALLDTFVRPYRVGGQEVLVREPCDWYCLPNHRGVGFRLMKFLIAQGDPLLGVAIAKGAIPIARRMNWTHLARCARLHLANHCPPGCRDRFYVKRRLGNGSIAKYLPRGIRLRPNCRVDDSIGR